jgi:hypothetical protein
MPPPPADRPARRITGVGSWLAPALLLTLAPKCVLCVLAYAGIGAALGLGGPEICGGPNAVNGSSVVWLSALGLAAGAVGVFAHRHSRRS